MLGLKGGHTVKDELRKQSRNFQQQLNPHVPKELRPGDDEPPPGQPSAAPREVKPDGPPAEPGKEAAKPGEPAQGEGAPPPAATPKEVVPVVPSKVKVGDKEYTPEELEKAPAEREKPQPVPPAAPPVEPNQGPTPEELAAHKQEFEKNRVKFVQDHRQFAIEKLNGIVTENTLEKIANGGPEAVAALNEVLADSMLNAFLLSRQALYQDFTPQVNRLAQQISPLLEGYRDRQYQQAQQDFVKTFPELEPNLKLCNQIADGLFQQYPEFVRRATREQFFAEVARQAKELGAGAPPAPAAPQTVKVGEREYTLEEIAALVAANRQQPTMPAAAAPVAAPPPPAGNRPGTLGGAPAARSGYKDPRVSETFGFRR
jgi:hypothetical protein